MHFPNLSFDNWRVASSDQSNELSPAVKMKARFAVSSVILQRVDGFALSSGKMKQWTAKFNFESLKKAGHSFAWSFIGFEN